MIISASVWLIYPLTIYFCRLNNLTGTNELEDVSARASIQGFEDMQISLLPVLPDWVLEKPHMVCPPKSIKLNELIGSGQYGTVYKGYYIHGQAR